MERCGLEELTDQELMALSIRDDRKAFEVLVLRYYQDVIRTAERMGLDKMQAQDIAQDCFADLYVQRGRYQPAFPFRTYLHGMVRHKSIDCLRKAGKEELLLEGEGEQWMEAQPGREQSPEEAYLKKECRLQLVAQIGQLPKTQRKALYLYAVEGRSYREIAYILQQTVPQVKIAIHRARKRLGSWKKEVWRE